MPETSEEYYERCRRETAGYHAAKLKPGDPVKLNRNGHYLGLVQRVDDAGVWISGCSSPYHPTEVQIDRDAKEAMEIKGDPVLAALRELHAAVSPLHVSGMKIRRMDTRLDAAMTEAEKYITP